MEFQNLSLYNSNFAYTILSIHQTAVYACKKWFEAYEMELGKKQHFFKIPKGTFVVSLLNGHAVVFEKQKM